MMSGIQKNTLIDLLIAALGLAVIGFLYGTFSPAHDNPPIDFALGGFIMGVILAPLGLFIRKRRLNEFHEYYSKKLAAYKPTIEKYPRTAFIIRDFGSTKIQTAIFYAPERDPSPLFNLLLGVLSRRRNFGGGSKEASSWKCATVRFYAKAPSPTAEPGEKANSEEINKIGVRFKCTGILSGPGVIEWQNAYFGEKFEDKFKELLSVSEKFLNR